MLVASRNNVFLVRQVQSVKGRHSLAVYKHAAIQGAAMVRKISVSRNGEYWVNTTNGLTRLDHELNFIQTINDKSTPNSLNSSIALSSFIDRSNCLWVGTSGGGANFCDLNQKLFYTIQRVPGQENSLSGNHVRSILEDGDEVWIGTNANGLNLYNLKTRQFSFYNTYNGFVRLKNDEVTALAFDKDHNLWIGGNAGIEIMRPDKKMLWKPAGYDQFPKMNIATLAKDCFGNIWFGNLDHFGVIWQDGSCRGTFYFA